MKAKFTTDLEIDLQGMSIMELNRCRLEIQKVIVQKQSQELPLAYYINDGRTMRVLSEYFQGNIPYPRDIAIMTKDQLMGLPGFANKCFSIINNMLIERGYDPLT